MTPFHRRMAMLGLLAGIVPGLAWAQSATEAYPTRPIRFVVPFAPGGPIDLIGRPLAERLTAALGAPVIVDNRAGANGIIGATAVARARPDGYTYLLTTGSFNANVALAVRPPFDAERDFQPVTQIAGDVGMVLVTRRGLPANDLPTLVRLAREQPGRFTYSMSGLGNITQIAAELFQREAGINLLAVPFSGTSASVTALLSGDVDVSFAALEPVLPLLADNQVRALAYTASERAQALPNVPTMRELGLPGAEVVGWYGLWAPAGTPMDRVQRLRSAVAEALRTPVMLRVLEETGLRPVASSPEEYAAFLRDDLAKQRNIVRELGLQLQ